MIKFIELLNEANEGYWAEMIFTRKLLNDVATKKRPTINGLGVVNRIEIPVGGKNVLLYQRGGKKDGSDYIRTRNIDEIIKVADQSSKSDIIINGRGCSVKAFAGSSPSIASHMNKKNFQNLLSKVGINEVNEFLEAVEKHNEECPIHMRCTLKVSDFPYNVLPRDEWVKLLSYLSFYGTATRDSKNPAEFVIEISKNGKSFKVLNKDEFINSVVERVLLWIVKDKNDQTKWSLNIRIKS